MTKSKYKTIWVSPETHTAFRDRCFRARKTADALIREFLTISPQEALDRALAFNRDHGYLASPSLVRYRLSWRVRRAPGECYTRLDYGAVMTIAERYFNNDPNTSDVLSIAAALWDAKDIARGCDLRDPAGPARNHTSTDPHWFHPAE